MQAGAPLKKAVTYGSTFKKLSFDEEKIQRLEAPILGFLMDKNFLHATALRCCLGKLVSISHIKIVYELGHGSFHIKQNWPANACNLQVGGIGRTCGTYTMVCS